MTIKTAVHTATMKCGYYDESSYQEWCLQGKELLMQYRHQQHARNQQQQQQQQQQQPYVVTVRKLHPSYQAKYKIQKYHRKSLNNKRTQLVSIPSGNPSLQHIQDKDTSHTSEGVIDLNNDDDNHGQEEEENPTELLNNYVEEDDGGLALMNDDDICDHEEALNGEISSIPRTTVNVIPTNTTEKALVQSPPSIASSLKRNNRSSDHLNDIIMMMKTVKKKKTKNVFSARSHFAASITMTSQRSTPDDSTTFIVKDTPPQFVALIEGICTTTKDTSISNGTDSYYASQRYHYLLDIVDHGHHHRLPKQGYATELPCASPAAPGPWMVQTIGSNNDMRMRHTTTTFFRNHQADWNGHRIRLVHTDYQLRIPQSSVNSNGDGSNDFTMVRIDPDRYRMSHVSNDNDNHNDCDDNDDKCQQTGTNSFIGAMGIVMFDGFASVSESETLQTSLAEVVLNALRQILGDNEDDAVHDAVHCTDKPTPIIPSFTTSKKRSIPMECTSGSGGIVVPINVGCKSTESPNNKVCDDSDYFVLLFICEATNQVVAIDVVFSNVFAIGSKGKKSLKGGKDSPATDSTPTPSLTHQNLQKHTSNWSTLNMLQRFWKKKEPQSPVDDILDKLSATMVLDEWTPHDEELVASTAHDNDEMDVVWDHDDKENSKPNPIIFEKAAVPSIPSKEENKCVPQEDRIFVTTDLPAATPHISFPLFPTNENAFISSLHRESLQVSTMMNQITPTPMQDQSNAMQLTKVGHTPLDLNCKTLFPESCQAKDDCTTLEDVTILSPSSHLNATASAPTAFHRSTSSLCADKDGSETSPSKSTGSSFLDCHQSMSSDPVQSEEDYFVDPIPDEIVDEHAANVEPFNVQKEGDAELHLETMLMADILFFELQNADAVPEMSTMDVAAWYEHYHADIDLWPTTDSTISLHDALFGGLIVLDPDRDRETFAQLFWYNWAWPMLTLVTAIFLFFGIVMDNQFLIDLLPVTINSLMYDDPSQGLLAPLMFVGTDFGYIGTVRIE